MILTGFVVRLMYGRYVDGCLWLSYCDSEGATRRIKHQVEDRRDKRKVAEYRPRGVLENIPVVSNLNVFCFPVFPRAHKCEFH